MTQEQEMLLALNELLRMQYSVANDGMGLLHLDELKSSQQAGCEPLVQCIGHWRDDDGTDLSGPKLYTWVEHCRWEVQP